MKKDIHPKVNTNVTVTCACGNTFVTDSTVQNIKVDICSKCHPLYTGKQKFVDTEGRIDKFKKKMVASEKKKAKSTKKKGKSQTSNTSPKSLKEIFENAKNS